MLRKHYAYAILLLSAGCASLGLAPAESFEQKLAYQYGIHTAVQQAASQALNDRAISSADATQVLKLADDARALLDGARIASQSGEVSTANGRLLLATNILVQLQAYLRSNQ